MTSGGVTRQCVDLDLSQYGNAGGLSVGVKS